MTTGQNEEPNFKDNVTNHDHTHNAPIAKATFSTPCVGIRCSFRNTRRKTTRQVCTVGFCE